MNKRRVRSRFHIEKQLCFTLCHATGMFVKFVGPWETAAWLVHDATLFVVAEHCFIYNCDFGVKKVNLSFKRFE